MPQRSKIQIPADYPDLLVRVKAALIEGQQRIEQERVRTYWETGRLIHIHILKHKARAAYGAQVIRFIAEDLNTDYSNLQRCVKFAKAYPRLSIVGGRPQFSWTHYRKLITISDDKKRLFFEKAASQNAWTSDELALRLKGIRPRSTGSGNLLTGPGKRAEAPELLKPLRGQPYTYQIIDRPNLTTGKSGLRLDLYLNMIKKKLGIAKFPFNR